MKARLTDYSTIKTWTQMKEKSPSPKERKGAQDPTVMKKQASQVNKAYVI